jgi:hypothetical protein
MCGAARGRRAWPTTAEYAAIVLDAIAGNGS